MTAAEAQRHYESIRLTLGSLDESAPTQLEAVDLPSGTVEAHPNGVTPTTLVRPAIVDFWLRNALADLSDAMRATTTEQLRESLKNLCIGADNARIHAGRLK